MEYAAFQGCFALIMVEMPGCVAFGVRLFSECCALEKVGIVNEGTSDSAKGAVIGPYAFECCAKLEQLSLPSTRAGPDALTMPSACRDSTRMLSLVGVYIGRRAYENCKQLVTVDISK